MAGLSPDQAAALRWMMDGRDASLPGPGGGGKTEVVSRYAAARSAAGGAVACVTPDPSGPLAGLGEAFAPWEGAALEAFASRHAAAGTAACLLVDEGGSASPGVLAASALFGQVVVSHDPAQGTAGRDAEAAEGLALARGARCATLPMLWRAAGRGQFGALNAIVYGGTYEAHGAASALPPDSVRESASGGPPLAGALRAGLRAVRTAAANPGGRAAVTVRTPEEMMLVLSVQAWAGLRAEDAPPPRMLHPAMMQGAEFDVLIYRGPEGASTGEREAAERESVVAAGRARFRLDLCATSSAGSAGAWLEGLSSWCCEALGRPPGEAGAVWDALTGRGLAVTHGPTHLAAYGGADSASAGVINAASGGPRATLSRAAAAAGRRWMVETVFLEAPGSGSGTAAALAVEAVRRAWDGPP